MPGAMQETGKRHPDYKQRIGRQYLQLLLERNPLAFEVNFEYMQSQLQQEAKTQIPDMLMELFGFNNLHWYSTQGLPTLYLGASRKNSLIFADEAEATIEVAHRAVPYGKGHRDHRTEPLQVRTAGVVDCKEFGRRIVAAEYDLPTGKLTTVNFSLSDGEYNNIPASTQAPLPTKISSPYLTCGLITPAMVKKAQREGNFTPHKRALVVNIIPGVDNRLDGVRIGNELYTSYIARINQPDCSTSIIRVWGTLEDEVVIYLGNRNLSDDTTGRASIVIPKRL